MNYPQILKAQATVILDGVKDLMRCMVITLSVKILHSVQDDSII